MREILGINRLSSLPFFEESPAYTPQANGAVERTVRSLKEQRQCMMACLEAKLKKLSLKLERVDVQLVNQLQ